jgi:hypothetical protein
MERGELMIDRERRVIEGLKGPSAEVLRLIATASYVSSFAHARGREIGAPLDVRPQGER